MVSIHLCQPTVIRLDLCTTTLCDLCYTSPVVQLILIFNLTLSCYTDCWFYLALHILTSVGNLLLNAWAAHNVGVKKNALSECGLALNIVWNNIVWETQCGTDFWWSLKQNLVISIRERGGKITRGSQVWAALALSTKLKSAKERIRSVCMYSHIEAGWQGLVIASVFSNECPSLTPSLTCSRHYQCLITDIPPWLLFRLLTVM